MLLTVCRLRKRILEWSMHAGYPMKHAGPQRATAKTDNRRFVVHPPFSTLNNSISTAGTWCRLRGRGLIVDGLLLAVGRRTLLDKVLHDRRMQIDRDPRGKPAVAPQQV